MTAAPRELRPHQTRSIASMAGTASAEQWRPVVGYEGLYEVSDLGRVRRLPATTTQRNRWGTTTGRLIPGRLLRLTADNGKHCYGRLTVKLSAGGVARTRLVHQIVAEAFIGPRPDGAEVAHNDGNPANNAKANLRYATPAENTADKFRHGTVLRGEAIGNSKLTLDQVRRIRALRRSQTVYAVAAEFSISIAQVSRICTGKRWRHIDG